MLAAVKLMCSHFLFNLDNAKHVVFGVEESQREVYLPTNKAPIYEGPDFTEINMPWLLHNFNFFRHHMLDEDAATLFGSIDALSTSQKPSAWRQPLQNGTYKLSKHWKGTYSYLDQPEIKKIRRMDPESVGHEFFIDKNIEDGKIQVSRTFEMCLDTLLMQYSLSNSTSYKTKSDCSGQHSSKNAYSLFEMLPSQILPPKVGANQDQQRQPPGSPAIFSSKVGVRISKMTLAPSGGSTLCPLNKVSPVGSASPS